jgi:hypothetical protein
MTPVLVSVDKAGDLKLGARKCRLYKKDEVVKVAKKYGINTEKKTVQQLCGSIKAKAKNSMNNVPLAKMYPEAAKKRTAAKKRAEKKALDRKIAANFMRNMTTKIPAPRPKPRSPSPTAVVRARANAKDVLQNRVGKVYQPKAEPLVMIVNQSSPRAAMRIARELRRLR